MWLATVGGLLHDVGKLYQRANWDLEVPRPHTYWTQRFVEGLGPEGLALLDAGKVQRLAYVASHHHELKPEGWAPGEDPLAWAVALADNYASNEREEAEEKSGIPHQVPLRSIFSRIRLQGAQPKQHFYNMRPLEPHAPFPSQSEPSLVYRDLTERLEKRLRGLHNRVPLDLSALLANLNAFLLEVAWCVPSDTQSEPDVSLYDHLRLTAAFAATLWRYHEQVDGEVCIERLKEEGAAKFLLVQGDFGGIQDHIYRIREAETGAGGIAKRLRARSLEVALATEALAREILDELSLPFLNRILSAGGRFTLLLPNTDEAKEVLQKARERWEAWALENGATLVPTIAWRAFGPHDLKKKGFGVILDESGRVLREEKLRPYAHVSRALLDRGDVSLRPCPVCDARPSSGQNPDGSWNPCERCQAEAAIGQRLPRVTVVGIGRSEPKPPYYVFPELRAKPGKVLDFVFRSRFDFSPDAKPFEVRPLTGHVPSVHDAVKLVEDYEAWLKNHDLDGVLETLGMEEGRPLTFEEIAHFSMGASYLGVLMLDADRMGEVFSLGLKHEGADLRTPSRIATLSRLFEVFFGFLAVELIENPLGPLASQLGRSLREKETAKRYPLIYSVYAGGDDVFLVGPWDALLQYALELEALYRRYTRHPGLTLSGGFILAKPHTPIPLVSDRVREAEKMAKNAGRNRLTAFGHAVEWQTLRELLQRGWRLYELIEKKELPAGIGHRLLALWDLYQAWVRPGKDPDPAGLRYKPLLFYLRRNEGVEKHWEELFRPLMDHEDSSMRHLPVWVQYALYLRRRR